MLRVVFVLVFGSSPLWVAGVLVWLGGRQSTSADYWNVAPWLIIFAFPLCGVTVAIALATVGAFSVAKGTLARKIAIAAACFAFLTSAVALFFYQDLRKQKNVAELRKSEQARVERFVSEHPAVRTAIGKPARASAGTSRLDSKGWPFEYDVYISSTPPVNAIVSVARAAGEATFSLRCITTLSVGYREAGADWCAANTLPLTAK